jgi:hypothetical protein
MRGRRQRQRHALRGRSADCEDKVAYHDILDKGNARDGALCARKQVVSKVPRYGCRRRKVCD